LFQLILSHIMLFNHLKTSQNLLFTRPSERADICYVISFTEFIESTPTIIASNFQFAKLYVEYILIVNLFKSIDANMFLKSWSKLEKNDRAEV